VLTFSSRTRAYISSIIFELSRHIQEAVIGDMRRLLQEAHNARTLIQRYEQATGRSQSRLLREVAAAVDRRHMPQINGSGENLLDVVGRIKQAQEAIKQVERWATVATDDLARSQPSGWARRRAGALRKH
jgi:hypothetical protein